MKCARKLKGQNPMKWIQTYNLTTLLYLSLHAASILTNAYNVHYVYCIETYQHEKGARLAFDLMFWLHVGQWAFVFLLCLVGMHTIFSVYLLFQIKSYFGFNFVLDSTIK